MDRSKYKFRSISFYLFYFIDKFRLAGLLIERLTAPDYLRKNILIEIIPAKNFKVIPWKNGKGETTELAINDGGTLENFDWRISIAKVVEDGVFSDFTGYLRNLVLIDGENIDLIHQSPKENAIQKVDKLNSLLDVATFDGACKTTGKLNSGSITDFNLITRMDKYKSKVETYLGKKSIQLKASDLCFLYCLKGEIDFLSEDSLSKEQSLKAGSLAKITSLNNDVYKVIGESMIIIYLDRI